jgi:hypothetical protein
MQKAGSHYYCKCCQSRNYKDRDNRRQTGDAGIPEEFSQWFLQKNSEMTYQFHRMRKPARVAYEEIQSKRGNNLIFQFHVNSSESIEKRTFFQAVQKLVPYLIRNDRMQGAHGSILQHVQDKQLTMTAQKACPKLVEGTVAAQRRR